ncbi:MAG: type I-E CRISPR-associated protein Cas6/Cse3/CasE [bacterium]|nr:type I-E CRISPR-associated protein Cas6/Cse3/CasE [bacterium]
MPSEQLFMVRLGLDPARLARFGEQAKLSPRNKVSPNDDAGYLAHMVLAGLFGKKTIQPFRVLDGDRARDVAVLGYSCRPEDALRAHADTFADPGVHRTLTDLAVKAMPTDWTTGQRLGFEVRVCPVVRLAAAVDQPLVTGEAQTLKKGAEIDAWVHRRWLLPEDGAAVGREEVYRKWLAERIGAAAVIGQCRLHAFRRIRVFRRDHAKPRGTQPRERPDALMIGELEVGDGDAFRSLLARGVGRHRAFGFGMLLLRPPGSW